MTEVEVTTENETCFLDKAFLMLPPTLGFLPLLQTPVVSV